IGDAKHVEVRGLVGDLDQYTIILSEPDLGRLEEWASRGCKFGIVSQTTQPLSVVMNLVEAVRRRFTDNDVRFVDTVCQPTKERQESMHRLATEAEVIVVVGGPDSNNSRKLTELARQLGRPAYQVASASELRPEWFQGIQIVGLTAGTST